MNKLTTYIAIGFASLAASCTSDDMGVEKGSTLKKTPLIVQTNLSAATQSRATDNRFDNSDQLLAYLRHVTWNGAKGARTQVAGDFAKRLVTFTFGSTQATTPTQSTTTDITPDTPLYWDDFSSSTTEETDLRTSGHYLQSYYGYCYNGGTPSTALVPVTGVLGWTAAADQRTAAAVKRADLVWSAEQTPVSYQHSTAIDGARNGLTIPYTHAMSGVTIIVNVDEGYTGEELDATAVTLNNFQNVGTFTAPLQEINATAKANIQMCPQDRVDKSRRYVAITVPKTNLTVGNVMATITGVDGNNYDIKVTEAVLTSWASQLDETDASLDYGMAEAKPMGKVINETIDPAKGYLTKPGVNYQLTVTISKVKIDVQASIADWTTVEATGTGAINFSADVKTIDKDNTITSGSFDIFHAEAVDAQGAFDTKSTTAEYSGDKWVNTPNIYWANGSTSYVFRGLASYDGTAPSTVGGSKTAAQGTDLIWATTPAHKGIEADGTEHDYARGAAINPRTANVPLEFEHIMSKITMNMVTSTDPAAALTLAGATISISNLSTGGTVNIADGAIAPSAQNAEAITDMAAPIANYCVIPQDLAQDLAEASIITITLADGTRYKLQLNTCKVDTGRTDSEGNPIYADVDTWVRGKHYTYTIYLEKEKITVRAMIKDWVDTNGSGNATLEWD